MSSTSAARPVGRRARRLASIVVAAVVLIAACQPVMPSSGATPVPGSSGAVDGATASLEPPTSFGPPPSPTPPDNLTPVVLDAGLLGVLPESIEGFAVTESLDEATAALADPALPRIATALDAAVAVDTATGNLVYALVVKLRPEAFNVDTFRQWRDSFDDGACAAAGGVVGHAESKIDERQVFVTSCAAGLHTYHAWLKEQEILISASSIGEGRFGEKLMDNLRVAT